MKFQRKISFTIIMLGILAATVFFIGCNGVDGSSYLKYTWVTTPTEFYDDNPSTPSTIYNDTYFPTDGGTYLGGYTTTGPSSYQYTYTISVNAGEPFFQEGDDLWYEIYLGTSGPTLYESDTERSVTGSINPNFSLAAPDSKTMNAEPSGYEIRETAFGTISLTWWKITD